MHRTQIGFDNISQAVADYYKYDKITNIERVNPESVTFPAIIICTSEGYSREHFINGSLIQRDTVSINLLKKFVDFEQTRFYSFSSIKYCDYKILQNRRK